ncbi:hypothetical protein [Ekhidna sp.]
MKNITFSADETLIKKARERARKENTTLNQRFREWLEDYSRNQAKNKEKELKEIFEKMSFPIGAPFTRDEMNERG